MPDILLQNGSRWRRVGVPGAARKIRVLRSARQRWKRGVFYLLLGTTVITVALVALGFHPVYFDRTILPDLGPFARFGLPTIGHIYDAHSQPLIEMAGEYRRNIQDEDLPPIVRDATLAEWQEEILS